MTVITKKLEEMILQKLPAGLLERLRRLRPEERPEIIAMKAIRRCLLLMVLTIAASLILYGGLRYTMGGGEELTYLTRPEAGAADRREEITVMLDGEPVDIQVAVSSRKLTGDEADALMRETAEIMIGRMLGTNPSSDWVSSDLDLTVMSPIDGIDAYWTVEEGAPISDRGEIWWDADMSEDRTVKITLHMNFEGREYIKDIDLTLTQQDEEQRRAAEVRKALEQAEAYEPSELTYMLPDTIGGRQASYYRKADNTAVRLLPVLGITAVVMMVLWPFQRLREEEERRAEELLMEYPELTSKLAVLVGAGLSVRRAWERMTDEYRALRAAGGERSALYEEMCYARRLVDNGTSESESYRSFGERTGLAEYIRLAGLMDSRRRNGSEALGKILRTEASEAGRRRLELARRRGERIAAELMLPMMVLFALVLGMIAIPAFIGW